MKDKIDKIFNDQAMFFENAIQRILIERGFDLCDHVSIRKRCEMRVNRADHERETFCIDGKEVADFVTKIEGRKISFDVVMHPPAELCA